MNLASVVGTATSTVKHVSMHGQRLLVLQPLLADGKSSDGDPVLAIDPIGARRGDVVVVSSDGGAVKEMLGTRNTPIRWSVLGIRD